MRPNLFDVLAYFRCMIVKHNRPYPSQFCGRCGWFLP